MRQVRTLVLPEPAPAVISNGPSVCLTASHWRSLRVSKIGFMHYSPFTDKKAHTVSMGPLKIITYFIAERIGGMTCFLRLMTLGR